MRRARASSGNNFVRVPRCFVRAARKRSKRRMNRFWHWLEMRARIRPPKTADFGAPTSSRFGFDGARFCST